MTLDEFLKLSRMHFQKSRWVDKANMLDEIKKELDEVEAEISCGSVKGIEDELGDVLNDVFLLIVKLEYYYCIDVNKSLVSIVDKLKRRKPHIFTDKIISIEEETETWNKAKEKE